MGVVKSAGGGVVGMRASNFRLWHKMQTGRGVIKACDHVRAQFQGNRQNATVCIRRPLHSNSFADDATGKGHT